MKMIPEDYQKIKKMAEAKGVNAALIQAHRTWLQSPDNPRKPKDLEKRLRWDVLAYHVLGSKWICDNLYIYLNDEHIDTAFRSMIASLERGD